VRYVMKDQIRSKSFIPHLIIKIFLWQVQRKRKKWKENLAYRN